MSSDVSQSEAQSKLQSLGDNKADYRPENIKCVSTDERLRKSFHLFTLHFYTLLKMYWHTKQCYFDTNNYHFHVMLLLGIVIFRS